MVVNAQELNPIVAASNLASSRLVSPTKAAAPSGSATISLSAFSVFRIIVWNAFPKTSRGASSVGVQETI
ncbi:hypothetical protein ACPOL_2652 [Acidisarcina polymorpha]|uniref:Uncharacterized protein n=1 Tax=Acidisarcina polymorpha TaxID=2211140 RepID=A0A2Z5FZZ4_9BACT|nr:hypothetical protein ACPOL_2652 [Acidisarcina polymorpha]